MDAWPGSAEELVRAQEQLARATPQEWRLPGGPSAIGGCFACFERGPTGRGREGEPAWAAAAVVRSGRVMASAVVRGEAGDAYEAGLLALREGAPLEAAVRALAEPPDVLLVDATGRDHPRRAGLALHLGVIVDLSTVGVTHRPLLAEGDWPRDEPLADPGAASSGPPPSPHGTQRLKVPGAQADLARPRAPALRLTISRRGRRPQAACATGSPFVCFPGV